MNRFLPALLLVLAACDGTAPAVQSPDKALNQDGSANRRCIANTPPAGYSGPVSPYSGACFDDAAPKVAPGGSFDYSKGMPPRQVR